VDGAVCSEKRVELVVGESVEDRDAVESVPLEGGEVVGDVVLVIRALDPHREL
jgi:hypothetical protein